MADFWGGFAQGFTPAYQRSADRRHLLADRSLSRQQRLDDILDAQKRQDQLLAEQRKREDRLLAEQIKRQEQEATRADIKRMQKEHTDKIRYQEDRDFRITGRDVQAEQFKQQEARLSGAAEATRAAAKLKSDEAKEKVRRGHVATIGAASPEIQERTIPKGGSMFPSIGDIPWTEDELATAAAKTVRLQEDKTSGADEMSPSQRRIKDLLKIRFPDATDQELAEYEWKHYERAGKSPTDKGLADITKVASEWQKASKEMDAKLAKGEKPTARELDTFWEYEFEIQSFFGKARMKVPQGVLETMKKVWRYPAATVEGPVLGAQDIALSGEELVRDLDYLVESLGQDRLDEHVGIWDETEDAIIKKLFPPGTSPTDKEFQAIQSFKQVYSCLANKTLYLRSGATVTEQEWNRLKKEIGVPDSADFYNRIRTFAKKERRGAKRLLQTRIKARYIFADELQDEIMNGLPSWPGRTPEGGIMPEIPQREPEATPPPLDTKESLRESPATDRVELEELINKGVPNLSPSEKDRLKELLKIDLNK